MNDANNSMNIPPRQWTRIEYINQLIDCFVPDKAPNDELEQGVKNNDIYSVRRAIARGADIERKTQFGETPLHLAASAHTEIALLLIEAGADIEAQNENGSTPLFIATYHKNLSLTMAMIKKGANLLASNNSHQNPIVCIIGSWTPEMLDSLQNNGFDINMKVKNQNSLLHVAVEYQNDEMVRKLLNLGVSVNDVNDVGVSPLHYAVLTQYPNQKIIDTLIDAGANVNLKTSYGKDVLEVCISEKMKKYIQARTATANSVLDVKSSSMLPGFNNKDQKKTDTRVAASADSSNSKRPEF